MELIPGFAAAERKFDRIEPNYGDIEAQERKQEQYKAFALADITKNVLKDDKTAEKVADEILGKFGTDEMVAVIRACFAGNRELAMKLILAHADQAMDTLAELEAYRAFN